VTGESDHARTAVESNLGWSVDLGLKGKVAIVAASSKGLGKASALALAREGARVTLCARTKDDLEASADEIRRATGTEVLAVPADLTRAEDIQHVVAATVERFGGVDVLVNNSGGPRVGKFPEFTDDDWREAFEVVTLNFVRFVREVTPHMREKRWGRIIGIQSTSVKEPVAYIDLSTIPVGRLGDPIELGHLVAFLASEQASYITGAVYQVDGGHTKSNT
jgi:3-oxoacyl-[acyl-carrier protein] reductase